MLIPAIHFPGTCAAAIALYEKVFKAEAVNIAYYRDAPAGSGFDTGDMGDWIMHSEIKIAGSQVNMCDVKEEVISGNMFLINIILESKEEVTEAYKHISEGGKIITQLGPQFWTSMYADVVDRFGVQWQIMSKS